MWDCSVKRPFVQLAAGLVGMMLMGVTYSWSFFILPLEKNFGWQRTSTSAIFSIFIIFFSAGSLAGGFLLRNNSGRRILLVVALLFFIGFGGSSFVKQLWQIFLCYGVLCGLASGFGCNAILTMVNQWFPKQIGFCSGILSMGFGGGSMVLGWLIVVLNENFGWRAAFRLFSVLFLAGGILLALILRPMQTGTEDSGSGPEGISPVQMIRTRGFRFYYLWSVSVLCVGLTILGSGAVLASEVISNPHLVALVTGLLSLCNGVGRLVIGRCYDNRGGRFALGLVTALIVIGGMTTCYALYVRSAPMLVVAFILTGLGYGGPGVCNSIIAWEQFGFRHYAGNYSILSTNGIPASVLGSGLMGAVLTKTGSYPLTYLLLNGYGIFGIVLVLAFAGKNGETVAAHEHHPTVM